MFNFGCPPREVSYPGIVVEDSLLPGKYRYVATTVYCGVTMEERCSNSCGAAIEDCDVTTDDCFGAL